MWWFGYELDKNWHRPRTHSRSLEDHHGYQEAIGGIDGALQHCLEFVILV